MGFSSLFFLHHEQVPIICIAHKKKKKYTESEKEDTHRTKGDREKQIKSEQKPFNCAFERYKNEHFHRIH